MTEHTHDHEAGPWLDDARRILSLIEAAGRRAAAGEGLDGQAPECAWCPLCQALAVARRSAPDLLDRVAEMASGLAATIRATEHDGPGPEARPESPAERREPPATVRIDITD